ncbi:MAG: tetratricopeptide repeat protein [Proteobacteria bacterium]|nr:tetratricopeptide repeat protein [Pseudomonadota bacterium]
MLESFLKRREVKNQKDAYDLFEKGISALDNHLFKQALIEFEKALKLDPKNIPDHLENSFHSFAMGGSNDTALSIGLVLLKVRSNDYILANLLGNCARKNRDYKQANNLYRHSLKINKGYELAFLNLAASMGKVKKFDKEVGLSIQQFDKMTDFILPDYYNNPEVIEELRESLSAQNEQNYTERFQELTLEKEQKEKELDLIRSKEISMELSRLKSSGSSATFVQIHEALIELSEEDVGPLEENEEAQHRIRQGHMFNVGLFALSEKRGTIAAEYFDKLLKERSKLEYVEMCRALAYEFNKERKHAVDIFIKLLGEKPHNRFLNLNLGLIYRRTKNKLLATKYLVVGAALLEKSDGNYRLSDLKRIAEENYQNGRYKKAIKLYNVIVSEQDDPASWINMGECYLAQHLYEDAAKAYKKLKEVDPDSPIADQKLRVIHDIYHRKGEEFVRDSKYRAAAGFFEKALKIVTLADTVKRAAGVYDLLKNKHRHGELMELFEEIIQKEKDAEQEKLRQDYILKGKVFMKRRDFPKAIENLELAFRMKLDKDVFMILATIFKNLKRNEEMKDLLDRWNRMVEHDDRMKKFIKEEERAQSS